MNPTPNELYFLSTIGIIIGCLIIGFAICWPIANAIGYRRGVQKAKESLNTAPSIPIFQIDVQALKSRWSKSRPVTRSPISVTSILNEDMTISFRSIRYLMPSRSPFAEFVGKPLTVTFSDDNSDSFQVTLPDGTIFEVEKLVASDVTYRTV